MTRMLLAFVIMAASLVSRSNSQPAPLLPDVNVIAQCYYHGIVGSLVNQCTANNAVPRCGAVAVPGFSYEACDCIKLLENGIDTIFVMDQLPWFTVAARQTSFNIWDGYLEVLAPALFSLLANTTDLIQDNYVGVIRPTSNGCDLYGFSENEVLRTALEFSQNLKAEQRYAYKPQSQCVPNQNQSLNMLCAREQVQHFDCVDMARRILLRGPAGKNPIGRRKNIISLRHTPGFPRSAGGLFQNEPQNGLGYLFITTANAFDTSDRDPSLLQTQPRIDFAQSEYDYGGFDRNNADFILGTSSTRIVNTVLNANPKGFLQCNDAALLATLRGNVFPEAFSTISPMMCTFFPRGPRLTWVALPVSGQGVVRGSVPVVTSWLCQLTPPTPAPTQSPTQSPSKSPTQSPTQTPTRNPTPSPTTSPTKSPTTCRGPPRDFDRPDCTEICADGQGIIDVTATPTLTTDFGAQTTTFCWGYTLRDPPPGACSDVNNDPIVGVSFAMDECCDDGNMDFVDAVSIQQQDFSRADCLLVTEASNMGNQQGCRRMTRSCQSEGNENALCTVINLNGLSGGGLGDSSGRYCLTMAGTDFEVNNRIDPTIGTDEAMICFERDGPSKNFCSCVPIEFVPSREVCKKTSNPSNSPTQSPTQSPTESPSSSPIRSLTENPTKSPTLSPTVCKGPPPDNKPDDCKDEECNDAVTVNRDPTVTVNAESGTTKLCWSYELSNPGSPCEIGDSAVVGVAFSMDECCDDGEMEFMSMVSIGSSMFSREECKKLEDNDSEMANARGCNRAKRACSAQKTVGRECSVINVNDVDGADGRRGEFCLTVVGTNFDNNQGQLIPGRRDSAKICFERGDPNPNGKTNVCACAEVDFIPSNDICDDTPSPTPRPTRSPVVSPTVCKGPPPDNKQDDCRDEECSDSQAVVDVDASPTVTTNSDEGTTTLCYSYSVMTPDGGDCAGMDENAPVMGVAFSMDECCDDGDMDFLRRVAIGSESFEREECPNVGSNDGADADAAGCNRATRPCSAPKSEGEECSVINVNDVDVSGNNEYCITVVGTDFESENEPGKLGGTPEKAKMCFERGEASPNGATNFCTCVEVEFIPSDEICDSTDSPTMRPTPEPTIKPTGCDEEAPEEPPVQGCSKNCGDIDNTEWKGYLVEREYNSDEDVTYFEYCVDMDDSADQECKPDAPDGDDCLRRRRSGGRRSGGRTGGGTRSWYDGGSSTPEIPEFASPRTLILRLDQCCDVCVRQEHFSQVSYGLSLRLTNPDYGSAYLSLASKKAADDASGECFSFKMNGEIGLEAGKYCVKGGPSCGPRCGCGDMMVPSSCDVKDYADPSCEPSSSSSSSGSNGGKSESSGKRRKKGSGSGSKSGSRGSNGGSNGGKGGKSGSGSGSNGGGRSRGGKNGGGSGGSNGGKNDGNYRDSSNNGGNSGKGGSNGGRRGGSNGGKQYSGGRSRGGSQGSGIKFGGKRVRPTGDNGGSSGGGNDGKKFGFRYGGNFGGGSKSGSGGSTRGTGGWKQGSGSGGGGGGKGSGRRGNSNNKKRGGGGKKKRGGK